MNPSTSQSSFSLLWPTGVDRPDDSDWQRWSQNAIADLGLDKIVNFFASDRHTHNRIRAIFLNLCQDPAVIAYRQDIIANLLHSTALAAGLAQLQPLLSDLNAYRMTSTTRGIQLDQLAWRLGQLELYVDCVQGLHHLLTDNTSAVEAPGLRQLRDLVQSIAKDPAFLTLAEEIPKMMAEMRRASSVTIGVNLDSRLRPRAATLLSINTEKFEGQSFLNRLFGNQTQGEDFKGITPLYSKDGIGDIQLRDLLKDLDRILGGVSKDIAGKLDRYTQIRTNILAGLAFDLTFYLGAIRLIEQVQTRNLPWCRPSIAPQAERTATISHLYDLNLALRSGHKVDQTDLTTQVVTNDVTFDQQGRIFILTGPNQGGKTTYTQAVGLAQVLFQAGLYIPGTTARLSPVDGIFTHFPVEENPNLEAGRFGEEAKRLNAIFQQATGYSLILLNESLTSTSEGESLYLAEDIVRALCLLGVRGIFATHLHTLAERIDQINAETQGPSRLISMVAGMDSLADEALGVRRTYKIRPGPPMGISYARDIAAQYGISLDKILETLQARQVLQNLE